MTTRMDVRHGESPRPMSRPAALALSGHGDPGRFGRMFPELDPLVASDAALLDLAQAMVDTDPADPVRDNPDIPAGFTYLGQFVDHDITLDLTPLDDQAVDPLSTQNFRTPALDLDALYGLGPALAPYMYGRDASGRITAKLLIGLTQASPGLGGTDIPAGENDLPRSRFGRAIIGDERNDENLLVAQTHLAFLKFHNAVVDHLSSTRPALTGGELFDEARRITTWHYQWIVLYDFVERLTEPGIIDRIRRNGRRFFRFRSRPYIPVEFSAAAYRLGHSMVRESYNHNAVFSGESGSFAPGTLGLLFHFTGKSGGILGDLAPEPSNDQPPLVRRLPSNWVIDWRRFFDFGTAPEPGFALNASRRLDPFVVPALHALPGEAGPRAVLPFRNLRRGVILGLPSGQDVAKAMGVPPLAPADIAVGPDGAAAEAHGLHHKTPLWYYILKEALVLHAGKRLGPVGTLIVAETFLGLVHGDHDSFLWRRRNWKPELQGTEPGRFTMVDMLTFIGELNPVGPAPVLEPAE